MNRWWFKCVGIVHPECVRVRLALLCRALMEIQYGLLLQLNTKLNRSCPRDVKQFVRQETSLSNNILHFSLMSVVWWRRPGACSAVCVTPCYVVLLLALRDVFTEDDRVPSGLSVAAVFCFDDHRDSDVEMSTHPCAGKTHHFYKRSGVKCNMAFKPQSIKTI